MEWSDIPTERRAHIEVSMEIAADFPDGAFMGFMQERGISVEEIAAYSEREEEPTDD